MKPGQQGYSNPPGLKSAGVVILAAGSSERMKSPKAFLAFDDHSTFIEQIISTYYNWGSREIAVVVNRENEKVLKNLKSIPPQVVVVTNNRPEYERFFSVKLGIGAIQTSGYCFIQNVDNPFIDGEILDLLYQNKSSFEYVLPVYNNKGGHPVLLNRKNMNYIRNWPVNNSNLKDVLHEMKGKRVVMKDDKVLININQETDYRKIVG